MITGRYALVALAGSVGLVAALLAGIASIVDGQLSGDAEAGSVSNPVTHAPLKLLKSRGDQREFDLLPKFREPLPPSRLPIEKGTRVTLSDNAAFLPPDAQRFWSTVASQIEEAGIMPAERVGIFGCYEQPGWSLEQFVGVLTDVNSTADGWTARVEVRLVCPDYIWSHDNVVAETYTYDGDVVRLAAGDLKVVYFVPYIR